MHRSTTVVYLLLLLYIPPRTQRPSISEATPFPHQPRSYRLNRLTTPALLTEAGVAAAGEAEVAAEEVAAEVDGLLLLSLQARATGDGPPRAHRLLEDPREALRHLEGPQMEEAEGDGPREDRLTEGEDSHQCLPAAAGIGLLKDPQAGTGLLVRLEVAAAEATGHLRVREDLAQKEPSLVAEARTSRRKSASTSYPAGTATESGPLNTSAMYKL